MIKASVTLDEAIELLNSALKYDQEAMQQLVAARVPCNDTLAEHPAIQVLEEGGQCKVGLLGILNGLFGVADDLSGAIAAEYGDDGKLQRFVFARYPS